MILWGIFAQGKIKKIPELSFTTDLVWCYRGRWDITNVIAGTQHCHHCPPSSAVLQHITGNANGRVEFITACSLIVFDIIFCVLMARSALRPVYLVASLTFLPLNIRYLSEQQLALILSVILTQPASSALAFRNNCFTFCVISGFLYVMCSLT